ncbi:MAG: hypothetical protein V1913_12200 [Fibrobacterota bacterium]
MTKTKASIRSIKNNGQFSGWHIQDFLTRSNEARPEIDTLSDLEGAEVKNQMFFHTFHEITRAEFTCMLPGCRDKFQVDIYPGQYVYPKYCEMHRSEYQRVNFNNADSMRLAG